MKLFRYTSVCFVSCTIALQSFAQVSLDPRDDKEYVSMAIAQQIASHYSQMKTLKEMMAYTLEGHSLKDKQEALEYVGKVTELPKVWMEDDLLQFSIDGHTLKVDVRQAYKGRFVIEGLVVTIDRKAPFVAQIKIIKRKLEEHLNPKFSIFSYLIPSAQASGKGKASLVGKARKYHRALSADEMKEIADAERKQASLLQKGKNFLSKHPFLALLIGGTTWKTVESAQATTINGAVFKGCKFFDMEKGVKPTQEQIDASLICPNYLRSKKKEKDDAETSLKAAEAKKKEAEEKEPAANAAVTIEELKKDEIPGVSISPLRNSCPHERKDKNARVTLAKFTALAGGDEKTELLLAEATLENEKLKEVHVYEYGDTVEVDKDGNKKVEKKGKGKGKLVAIYKFEDSKFKIILLPMGGKSALPFEEVSAIEDLPKSHARYNDQKLQRAVHSKFQLSYLACAGEEEQQKGQKAAASAMGLATPGKQEKPAAGAK